MSQQITKEQFDALRPQNSDLVRHERDGEYAYEIIVDDAGTEIAFASYQAGECTSYTKVA